MTKGGVRRLWRAALWRLGGALFPGPVGRAAFDDFCTPGAGRDPGRETPRAAARAEAMLAQATPVIVEFDGRPLAVHRWSATDAGPGRRRIVVLVHGWAGDALSMIGFVAPLRRAGFEVVAYDGPAHGRSPGNRTNMPDSARALHAVCAACGPVQGLIGHSFGAMVVALAAEGGPPLNGPVGIRRVVLIGAPNRLRGIVQHYYGRTGLAARARRVVEARIEALSGRPVDALTTAALLRRSGVPGLVVHDTDDRSVGVESGHAIVADNPALALFETSGLGHYRPLFTRGVWKAAVEFLGEAGGDTTDSPDREQETRQGE